MSSDDELERQDAELIRTTFARRKSPYPHLLTGGHGTLRGLIGPSITSASGLVDDYFELGHKAVAGASEERKLDLALLPVMFLYRHAVELSLKYAIALMVASVEDDQPEKTQDAIDNHSLAWLVTVVKRLFPLAAERLKPLGVLEPLTTKTLHFINQLHALDKTGQTFRYVYRKADDSGAVTLQIENDVQISVDALAQGMAQIQDEMNWFLMTLENGFGALDDFEADVMSDIDPW